ncbi:hypothetical protein ACJMK2_020067 [Sinanodonta woodiana]|uniref:Fibrinogen C-terminal domain-containing protein n=1 Tax=Sinanodonta woodiana TaxID=1069815 RepID=A0ABD3TZ85_SINWO
MFYTMESRGLGLWGMLTLLCLEVVLAEESVCRTMQYRVLSPPLQNEHHCLLLEKLQRDFEYEKYIREKQYDTVYSMLNKMSVDMKREIRSLDTRKLNGRRARTRGFQQLEGNPLVRDCYELKINNIHLSGVYPIRLPDFQVLNVWCDMELGSGGWTVIQRRLTGKVSFTRKWDDYAYGFGNINSEYWLGNEHIHEMTKQQNYSLRIDLWDWEDNHAYAEYDTFKLANENEGYSIHVTGYHGTAGDSLSHHNGMRFTTSDRDGDIWFSNCADKDQSGWWFKACGFSLNGMYIPNGTIQASPDGLVQGIIWYTWRKSSDYSLMRVEMKIKPQMAVRMERQLQQKLNFKSENVTFTNITETESTGYDDNEDKITTDEYDLDNQ